MQTVEECTELRLFRIYSSNQFNKRQETLNTQRVFGMDSIGGLGMQSSLFFDAGLGFSSQSNSTSSISSGSPPVNSLLNSLAASNGVDAVSRPSWLFGTQIQPSQSVQKSSPDSGFATSLFDPFAPSPLDSQLSISQLAGTPLRQMNDRMMSARKQYGMLSPGQQLTSNPLGAPGTPINMPTSPLSANTNGSAPPPKNPKLYKTELCRSWMEHGRCNYGERCQYAHGDQEKRPVPRHPKYKTEACQSFHQTGYCPYGPRCHFIHNESEMLAALSSPASMFPSAAMRAAPNTGPGGPAMTSAAAPMQNMLQRMTSLPNYGSAGESSSSSRSSDGSGSHSPNGSFSPGLDIAEDYASFNGFQSMPARKATNAFGSRMTSRVEEDNGLLSGMLSGLMINEDHLAWQDPRALSNGSRLPVFAQLSGK